MDKSYYLKKKKQLVKRKRIYSILRIFLPILLFITYSAAVKLVGANLFGLISTPVSKYLLHTIYSKFSVQEYTNLFYQSSNSALLLYLTLIIYWGSQLLLLFALIMLLIQVILRPKPRKPNPTSTFVYLNELIELLKIRRYDKPRFWYLRFMLKLIRANIEEQLNPLEKKWFKNPTMQWFKSSVIEKNTRDILFCISKISSSLSKAIKINYDIEKLLIPLSILEEYFYSLSLRLDDSVKMKNVPNIENEILLLNKFAKESRALIIDITRLYRASRIKTTKRNIFYEFIRRIFDSTLVRASFLIALISAIAMLIGVLLFGIDKSQAFLAWFTVTFGSFSVSIGVVSFKYLKTQQNIDE